MEGGKFLMDVEIPANTTASIFMSGRISRIITESGKPLSAKQGNSCIGARKKTKQS